MNNVIMVVIPVNFYSGCRMMIPVPLAGIGPAARSMTGTHQYLSGNGVRLYSRI